MLGPLAIIHFRYCPYRVTDFPPLTTASEALAGERQPTDNAALWRAMGAK